MGGSFPQLISSHVIFNSHKCIYCVMQTDCILHNKYKIKNKISYLQLKAYFCGCLFFHR